MQMPSPDRFTRLSGYEEWPPWAFDFEEFTLTVPDWEDAPHPSSLALAERVMPDLAAMQAEAAAHVERMVDRRAGCLLGEPYLLGVHASAHEGTVTLELVWDGHVYTVWYVTFGVDPRFPRRIQGFGCRPHTAHVFVERRP